MEECGELKFVEKFPVELEGHGGTKVDEVLPSQIGGLWRSHGCWKVPQSNGRAMEEAILGNVPQSNGRVVEEIQLIKGLPIKLESFGGLEFG